MDIAKFLKELNQRETEYERNMGSLSAVLEYNPELDLEGGMKEEEDRKASTCVKSDIIVLVFCVAPVMVLAFALVGYTVYYIVTAALEVSEEYQ